MTMEMVTQHDAESTKDVNECDLSSDLEQLDALMAHLELKRLDLRRRINRRDSPIIRQFPHEVLSTVFNFCLPDHTTYHTSLSKPDLSASLILGAVCKDWRETAWSSPRLWSAMSINVSTSNAIFQSQVSLAQDWLARSGQLPLSIRIVLKCDLDDSNLPLAIILSTLVSDHSSRWHTLHLDVPPKIYDTFSSGPDFSAPILESLYFHSDIVQRRFPHPNFSLLYCPRLQELRTTKVFLRRIQVPMDNITRVYTDNLGFEECRKILQECPLVHCELMNIGLPSSLFDRAPLSTNLKHLTIRVGMTDEWFDDITAPFLETLRIEATYGGPVGNWDISGIRIDGLRTLVRSAPSLHTFSFVKARFQRDGMMSLLRAMPTVKFLTISVPTYYKKTSETEIILQILAIIASHGKLSQRDFLPNLETLTFVGHRNFRAGKVPYLNSIGPWILNYAPQRPLCSVTLKFYGPVKYLHEESIPFFLGLKERGMSIKVCTTSGDVEDLLQSTIDFYKSPSLGAVEQIDDLYLGLIGLGDE